MPAARTIKTPKATSAVKAVKPASKSARSKAPAPILNAGPDFESVVPALRTAEKWSEIIALWAGLSAEGDAALNAAAKGAICRAASKVKDLGPEVLSRIQALAQALVALEAENLDGLLCLASVASKAGEHKAASDLALQALKASEYKDQDAIALLQESQIKGHQSTGQSAAEDPYSVLHVSKTAPLAVIQAAHSALKLEPDTPEAKAADEALRILSEPASRKAVDERQSRTKTAGFGREFSGGTDVLQQLIQILGIRIPEGFVLPANGRFQGGFGGGIEFTWGDDGEAKGAADAGEAVPSDTKVQPLDNGLQMEISEAGLPTPPISL